MDSHISNSIPKPLVSINQWFIVISVVVSWLTNMEWLLILPFIAGLSGLLFRFNPVMHVGKRFLKKEMSSYPPEDFDQQQFNGAIAVVCLGSAFISSLIGWSIGYYLFSGMVFLAASIALLGFCVGCFIRFQFKKFQHNRSKRLMNRPN
ncbi:DUF4395 domain-containing protein [Rossellomorea aquimaris]|uniref:DUF4395 domain-containing protein n=1 Tax=Rossellomorea aquimaris TaxID=189382 RepID=UPI0009ED26ED|nr:DUF4395 domain-containing protein [Rossellomorea aquimaris]